MSNTTVGNIGVARVVVQLGDQTAMNVIHMYCVNSVGLGATNQQIADDLDLAWRADYLNLLPTAASFRGVDYTKLEGGLTLRPSHSGAGAIAGNVASDPLPRGVSGLIAWSTPLRGRSHQGRVFIPFASETHNDGSGKPTAGYVALLDTLKGALLSVITCGAGGNTANMQLGIYHPGTNTVEPNVTGTSRPYWSHQNRRSDTGRPNPPPF